MLPAADHSRTMPRADSAEAAGASFVAACLLTANRPSGVAKGDTGCQGNPMDRRIESFLADGLPLAGEDPDSVREGVRVALAKREAIFRLQEPNKRMREPHDERRAPER